MRIFEITLNNGQILSCTNTIYTNVNSLGYSYTIAGTNTQDVSLLNVTGFNIPDGTHIYRNDFPIESILEIPSGSNLSNNNQIKVIKSDVCNSNVFLKCLSMKQLPQPISKIESFYQYQVTDKGRHPA